MTIRRVPAGQFTGGQFATGEHAEPSVGLATPSKRKLLELGPNVNQAVDDVVAPGETVEIVEGGASSMSVSVSRSLDEPAKVWASAEVSLDLEERIHASTGSSADDVIRRLDGEDVADLIEQNYPGFTLNGDWRTAPAVKHFDISGSTEVGEVWDGVGGDEATWNLDEDANESARGATPLVDAVVGLLDR